MYEQKRLEFENYLHSLFESVGFLDNLFARATYISNELQKLCERMELYNFKINYEDQDYIIVYYEFRKAMGFYSVVDKITQRKTKLERILK